MKEKKLVVFDMDGTLNRIELFIIPTYKEVLRRFANTEADDDTVLRLMGCVDEEIYQGLLPGAPMERFDEFMAMTAEAEYRNIDRYHGTFEGVPEMVRQLSDEGYIQRYQRVCAQNCERAGAGALFYISAGGGAGLYQIRHVENSAGQDPAGQSGDGGGPPSRYAGGPG